MIGDDLDESLAKLPVLVSSEAATNVKRGEVFCSKIIHQKATHQSRFQWSSLFKKIMEYAHPDCAGPGPKGEYPRPLKSPFPCFQCHRYFSGPPIFIAIVALNGNRTEWGNFCDPKCANTYLHLNMNDSNLAARVADLHEYCQDVHGMRGEAIGFAPHFTLHEKYGGNLTDAKFDQVARTKGLRTHERKAPFIPTDVVIEWQCRLDDVLPQENAVPVQAPAPPAHVSAFQRCAQPAQVSTEASAADVLANVMGSKPDAAHHHHQWEVRGLKQPSQENIERRLLSLPRPEQKEGLYDLYWRRKGYGHPASILEMTADMEKETQNTVVAPHRPVARNKRSNKPSGEEKAMALDANHGSGLGAMLVPAKRPKF